MSDRNAKRRADNPDFSGKVVVFYTSAESYTLTRRGSLPPTGSTKPLSNLILQGFQTMTTFVAKRCEGFPPTT
jgi:hypothetical protein